MLRLVRFEGYPYRLISSRMYGRSTKGRPALYSKIKMALNFFGYVEAPGEEFSLPGLLTSPLFGEKCLYPVWSDSYEDLFWISVKNGEMYVCSVWRDEEWEFDTDTSFWMKPDGELSAPGEPVPVGLDTAIMTELVEGWNEVVARCELSEKMNAPGA